MLLDRAHHPLEVIVEDAQHDRWRKTVREPGESPQIGNPDHGFDGFVHTTIDFPVEYTHSCAVAQIGVHEVARDRAYGEDFENQ